MIFVPNQLVGAPTGTNVTIDCHTEAYPRAMSYWFLGDEMILSTDKYTTNIMENSYRAHMRLTIRNLTASDFGSYRCISKNSLGETEGSIRLYRKPMCILSRYTMERKGEGAGGGGGGETNLSFAATLPPRRTAAT
jgi:hypothetical protein